MMMLLLMMMMLMTPTSLVHEFNEVQVKWPSSKILLQNAENRGFNQEAVVDRNGAHVGLEIEE